MLLYIACNEVYHYATIFVFFLFFPFQFRLNDRVLNENKSEAFHRKSIIDINYVAAVGVVKLCAHFSFFFQSQYIFVHSYQLLLTFYLVDLLLWFSFNFIKTKKVIWVQYFLFTWVISTMGVEPFLRFFFFVLLCLLEAIKRKKSFLIN